MCLKRTRSEPVLKRLRQINNAGTMLSTRQVTSEGLLRRLLLRHSRCVDGDERAHACRAGFEASFAVNTLGTFLLTELMVPHLSRQADARVVRAAVCGATAHVLMCTRGRSR